MLASAHVADVGARTALAFVRRAPKPGEVDGLRHANVALAAPLSGSLLPSPELGRVGLVAFWDDDAALDGFLAAHPLAETLAGGWRIRLEPLRAFGSWPGLPSDVPTARATDDDGPAAVLTLGRLRLSQTVRFLRTSAKAEARAVEAPGMIWATGLARPPFVATCSLWESTRALSTYAFGHTEPAHADAITEGEKKEFHHQSAFIRFRPYGSEGGLDGKNPLAECWSTAKNPG
jgi:hypothetical protein